MGRMPRLLLITCVLVSSLFSPLHAVDQTAGARTALTIDTRIGFRLTAPPDPTRIIDNHDALILVYPDETVLTLIATRRADVASLIGHDDLTLAHFTRLVFSAAAHDQRESSPPKDVIGRARQVAGWLLDAEAVVEHVIHDGIDIFHFAREDSAHAPPERRAFVVSDAAENVQLDITATGLDRHTFLALLKTIVPRTRTGTETPYGTHGE